MNLKFTQNMYICTNTSTSHVISRFYITNFLKLKSKSISWFCLSFVTSSMQERKVWSFFLVLHLFIPLHLLDEREAFLFLTTQWLYHWLLFSFDKRHLSQELQQGCSIHADLSMRIGSTNVILKVLQHVIFWKFSIGEMGSINFRSMLKVWNIWEFCSIHEHRFIAAVDFLKQFHFFFWLLAFSW